jgi:hypothetical protein
MAGEGWKVGSFVVAEEAPLPFTLIQLRIWIWTTAREDATTILTGFTFINIAREAR